MQYRRRSGMDCKEKALSNDKVLVNLEITVTKMVN